MGKSPASKATSANAKKLGVAKSKASSVGKKAMKKRLEIDLEQPKDRDPVNSNDVDIKQIADDQDALRTADEFEAQRIAERESRRREDYNKLVPKLSEWWSKKLYCGEAVNQAMQRMDRIQTGNALFAAWDDRYPGAWNQPCLRFDALFNNYAGTSTCNDRFLQIFTYLNSDNAQLAQYLISSFDLYTIEDTAAEDVWSLRVLAMQISLQNPFSFFDIDEFEKNQNNNQFFEGDKSDPRLRLENPLVGFWLICSEMFDYPWATTFDDNYYNKPSSSIIRGIKQKRLAPFQSFFRPESSNHHIQHAIQKISDPVNDHLDKAEALADEDGSSGGNADNAEAADDNATTIDGDAYQQPNQDDNDDEILLTAVRNIPRRPPLSSDDEDDGDEDDDDNENDDAVTNGEVVQTESVEALVRSEDDNMAVDNLTSPTQVSQDSSSLIHTPPPTRRLAPPPTLAEKLNKLIQVNLDGMTCRCHIFETTFATNFSGSDSGTVAEAILSAVLTSMEEALNNSFHELKILPISDDTYKQQNRWIRNSVELRNKISSYRALSLYCDMEYGNSPYAATNSKPGEKKLRTRMRVGFARDTSEEAVQDYLHTGLRSQGRGAGCYPSPLQYGDIVKVGCFAFIPPEVNFDAYAKEIMRHFDFSIPIGIKMDWVSTPYTGRAKFNERSPGVTSPHGYARKIHAKRVDQELRSLLNPSTAKPDFPFAAPATFISDWKSAQQGLISVKAYGPVKDATLTLISKLHDYYILTEVLYSVMDLPGMFKFATTTTFGSCTLFKLLLSIKATSAQANKASHVHQSTTETDDSDDDSDNDSSDDDPNESSGSKGGQFTGVRSKKAATKVKKKAKKKKKLITDNENPFLNDLSPAQRKMAEVADRKLKNDQERHKSGPLFLMVLPGEMEGTYILDIISPVLQVCLPKSGVCRNFPRSVVFAPVDYQGLGVPHPFGKQVYKHLEMILRHMLGGTKTGAYLDANLQAHQLETGTSFGLLQQDYQNTSILASDTWLKRVWKELESLDMYMAFDSPALSLRCHHDALLIDLFMDLEVDQDDLLWLNWCRMFL
ncbi:unnamed protein product, partial [Cylindrotheca closterium]